MSLEIFAGKNGGKHLSYQCEQKTQKNASQREAPRQHGSLTSAARRPVSFIRGERAPGAVPAMYCHLMFEGPIYLRASKETTHCVSPSSHRQSGTPPCNAEMAGAFER